MIGTICMPGNVFVLADSEEISEQKEEDIEDVVSYNGIEMFSIVSENGDEEIVSENTSQKSKDSAYNERITSENKCVVNETIPAKSLSVSLPRKISCYMMLYENRRNKGLVGSEQFFIENNGFEDVIISLKGICQGQEGKDYIFSDASVENDIVQGKKNVYVYLKWEDENGRELEQSRMVMRDISSPGEAEIILKAPIRSDKGEVMGDSPGSRAYFSFGGDLNSDTGEAWEYDELRLDLSYSIKVVGQDMRGVSVNCVTSKNNILELDCTEDFQETEDVSENNIILGEMKNVSENNAISENIGSISENDIILEQSEGISENDIMIEGLESSSKNDDTLKKSKNMLENNDILIDREDDKVN